MDRRTFLCSTGFTALGAMLPGKLGYTQVSSSNEVSQTFRWSTKHLQFVFDVYSGRLRQGCLLPLGFDASSLGSKGCSGVEVAIQCSGENSPDQGMKEGVGQPGARLAFADKSEEITSGGTCLILKHTDQPLNLTVESIYESFDAVPVVRRRTRVMNTGTSPVGIDFLSSAMLHGLADPQSYESELRIHLAYNSWMSEGQWHTLRPSELGLVENERTSWSEARADSVGSWSSEKYLPMAMVENKRLGVTWFWQIEHNGSWYWEISNVAFASNNATDVYAYLGGPDDLHAAAWKNLQPGQSYETVPVALGCVRGGFAEAVEALTLYRRSACQRPRRNGNSCPVIFNDYMNCLWGDPTEEKELPLIEAAAKAGCEYYVIDAGWYANLHEDWSRTIGSWEPSPSRWPRGLKFILDKIKDAKMVPGLWLEPEVAGDHSQLAQKPDNWFFMRHGKRVLKNSRFLLDFRNPAVTPYLDQVIARLVNEYGVGYIKMDYNVDSLQGTELNADSVGQGLLEHNRAHLAWLDRVENLYPELVIENCGSGGGRTDYAMLSRLQIQSATDQEDYLKLPAIMTGSSAGVLPEQLACWSYPLQTADADQASFNMVTAMICRIHQSGRPDRISPAAQAQVYAGIRLYKETLRKHVPQAVPFYPLGLPDATNNRQPIALGMKSAGQILLAAWRLAGPSTVELPCASTEARLLYPTDLGIQIQPGQTKLTINFPRPNMGCLITL